MAGRYEENNNVQNPSALQAEAMGPDYAGGIHGMEAEDIAAQIGESETWLDQIKTMVRQNKLAAFSALVILVIILAAIFAPLVAP